MTRATIVAATALLISGCGIFGGDEVVEDTCSEPLPYQSERLNDPIKAPEGLDDLDKFREMPIPEAETPPRAEDAGCITKPPSVRSD